MDKLMAMVKGVNSSEVTSLEQIDQILCRNSCQRLQFGIFMKWVNKNIQTNLMMKKLF